MLDFIKADGFIFVWGAAILLYWPAGVALSIVGLAADGLRRRRGERAVS